ncbi:heavy-metal-associated domain-containing protein [Lactobacillus gallinarum]|uniref:heavy-metal-associated domain-containing protein n=1 Tax=Lactobacillus gallinarum TaxID=52242 RepID=UPI000B37B7C7|nr:cation transporter [Lactobacillus gallinarum]OUP98409.1 copper-binding protein [Lactobacillus gallinarum]
MQKVMMKLGGMTCPSCLTKIEKAVEDVDGTDQIKVLFNAGKLKFMMNTDKADVADVKTAIEKMGYEVKDVKAKELN